MTKYTLYVAPYFSDEMIAILQTYADEMFVPKVRIERYKDQPDVPAKKYKAHKGVNANWLIMDELGNYDVCRAVEDHPVETLVEPSTTKSDREGQEEV